MTLARLTEPSPDGAGGESKLRVVAYNVRFGDAILIEIPERDGRREVVRLILIDVGKVLAGQAGSTRSSSPCGDLRKRLDGRPMDLYMMAHEHLGHVQGLPRAARAGLSIPVSFAWLTASAEPAYDDRSPPLGGAAVAQSHYELVKLAAERRGARYGVAGSGQSHGRDQLRSSEPRSIAVRHPNWSPARVHGG